MNHFQFNPCAGVMHFRFAVLKNVNCQRAQRKVTCQASIFQRQQRLRRPLHFNRPAKARMPQTGAIKERHENGIRPAAPNKNLALPAYLALRPACHRISRLRTFLTALHISSRQPAKPMCRHIVGGTQKTDRQMTVPYIKFRIYFSSSPAASG